MHLKSRVSAFGGRGHSADWAPLLWSLPFRISLSVPTAEKTGAAGRRRGVGREH